MALLQFGGGITEMRGSIGGTVYSRNRSGAYARARTTPVNPNSDLQNLVRDSMSNAVALWANTLTQVQRDQWGVYAAAIPRTNKVGQTIFNTGFNWFTGNNTMRLVNGLLVVADGPATLSLPIPDSTLSFTASESTQLLTIAFDDTLDWLDETGAALQIQMGMPQPITREFFNGPWRIAGAILGDDTTAPTTPTTITAPFPIQEGQLLYIEARITRADGRVSDKFRSIATAAA